MKDLKKRMPKLIAAVASFILILSMVLLPIMADMSIPLPSVPTPSAPAYSTSYQNGVYTLTLNSGYLTEVIHNREFNKETLRENLPEEIYQLVVERDPSALKSLIMDMLSDMAHEYMNSMTGSEETETAATPVPASRARTMALATENETTAYTLPEGVTLPEEIPDDIESSGLLDKIPDDFKITADNINKVLNVVNGMIENGVLTMEQVENIVSAEKLQEIFDLPVENPGETVKIQDILDGKYNDQIVESNKTMADIKPAIDEKELEKIEIKSEDMIPILINAFKEEILQALSEISGIRIAYGDEKWMVYANSELNLSALDQAVLNAIPTLDEIAEMLAAEGDYAEVLHVDVDVLLLDDNAEEGIRTVTRTLQVRFDGSAKERDVLRQYAERAARYASYEYTLPTIPEGTTDRFADDLSDGHLALNLTMPEGLLEAAITSIDETKLSDELRERLGDVADLDFSDRDNRYIILNRIINNFSLVDLARLFEAVNPDVMSDEVLDRIRLTPGQIDALLGYYTRAIDKAYSLAQEHKTLADFEELLASKKLANLPYAGNGVFTFEGTYQQDLVALVGKYKQLPEEIKNRLTGTVISHSISITFGVENLYRVDYVSNGSGVEGFSAYLPEGATLTHPSATLAPNGWASVESAAEGKTVDVMPASDVTLAALHSATFEAFIIDATGAEVPFKTETKYYTELKYEHICPTIQAPYAYNSFDWDWAGVVPANEDVIVKGVAKATVYNSEKQVTLGGKVYTYTLEYDIHTDMYEYLTKHPVMEEIRTDLPGFEGVWGVVEKKGTKARSIIVPDGMDIPEGAVEVQPGEKSNPNKEYSIIGVRATEYKVIFKDEGGNQVGEAKSYTVLNALADPSDILSAFDEARLKNYILGMAPNDDPSIGKAGYTISWNVPAITRNTLGDIEVTVVYTAVSYTAHFGYYNGDTWVRVGGVVTFTEENFREQLQKNRPPLPGRDGYEAVRWIIPASFAEAELEPDGKTLRIEAEFRKLPDVIDTETDPGTETETDEPGTETETDDPGTETGTETETDEPGTDTETERPGTDTDRVTDPGSETKDENEDKNKFPWWILFIIILVIAVIVVLVIILRRKAEGEEPTDEEPTDEPTGGETETSDEETDEESEDSAPLFIPIGEEVPEEEIPDEIEVVEEVSAETVDDLMTDKAAEYYLENTNEEGGEGKMGIINVGQLCEVYNDGDTVDLADLQAKGLVDDNIGRLKVLAAGVLNKHLTVKADAFSVQAIKMITLTGGHAIKLGCDDSRIRDDNDIDVNAVADETVTEGTVTEEIVTEETTSEETDAEETAEKTVTEETPVEETPAEENNDVPTDDQ